MFDDVLDALLAAGLVDVRVLAADAQAAAAATQRGLSAILDPVGMEPTLASAAAGSSSDARLRRAVDAGLHGVGDTGVRLVVAADLPLLRAKDVEAVLASAADVTVARTRGGGTALLRLGRSVVIPTCYGHGSAEAHLATARARGLSTDSLDLCGAHSDVDGADDLHADRKSVV
jgi:2-phospho-L-lactate guanylyltransferase (CobY/MobA/RfbA family)